MWRRIINKNGRRKPNNPTVMSFTQEERDFSESRWPKHKDVFVCQMHLGEPAQHQKRYEVIGIWWVHEPVVRKW